ncbi:uncharacterized protein LOC131669741 isoform X2 [Phymastichus coffea]|uniref:uncharacterized protein LOC131669741 isoform X2 n=1 Tax=Phymastichus coffea TaxID=108790 RepID=UPI00273B59F2|nr:uncharacterized protein LOC131669741 isoform X2 [Phymastichus coffea]
MNKGCWKLNEDETEEETEDEKKDAPYSEWDLLPDILLEEIFSYLTIKERYYASLVCQNWYRAFKLPYVWSTFTLADTTLVRGKFNYYSGWQYVLDHMRTSTCLNKIGRNFKCLIFEPMMSFQNLFEFMNMISWYSERQKMDKSMIGIGTNIKRLKFTFPCDMANRNRDNSENMKLFGTGGKLLEALKRLMRNLENIKSLELIDLMLENKEAMHLMDDICANCTQTLKKLVLINTTRQPCPLLHVGVFLNLKILVISPQNLHEDVIELLGYTQLQHLHILQNRYSPKDIFINLPKNAAWRKMKSNNPHLRVHFEIESQKPLDIILPFNPNQPNEIPCQSIVLDNPNTQIPSSIILQHAIHFNKTLRVYALRGLTRYYLPRVFPKRVDEAIVKLCKLCPDLHTLMIRNKISTATILEIVSIAKSLRFLYVRRNVVLKKCDADWLSIVDWPAEHYKWIKDHCNDYEKTEREVSRILGYRWRMLSEKEFAKQAISLHV